MSGLGPMNGDNATEKIDLSLPGQSASHIAQLRKETVHKESVSHRRVPLDEGMAESVLDPLVRTPAAWFHGGSM